MWPADRGALTIESGAELEQFDLGDIVIGRKSFTVLTGYENAGRQCWWCGGELPPRAVHYCRGHMKEYYNHFNWGYASYEARQKSKGICANCSQQFHAFSAQVQVHHIVPIKGQDRFFSVYNLPWNLIVLCVKCHVEVHAAMRPVPKPEPTRAEIQIARGQLVLLTV